MAVTYCSASDVRTILPKVTANVMADNIGTTTIESHITRAENIINAKIGSRYSVPFASGGVPPVIKTICTDLAGYYVMRTLFTHDSQNRSEWVNSFKECIDLLDKIANGDLALLDSTGQALTISASPISSNTKDYHPIFNIDAIEESTVDHDLLDSIAIEREDD